MWTVTVDSNVPIKTGVVPRSVSPSPSDPGSRSRARSFTPDKYLQASANNQVGTNDVETLLSSTSPERPRASSFRSGRPPPSAVRAVAAALRSRSGSGSRPQSPVSERGNNNSRASSPEPRRSTRVGRAKANLPTEDWREEQWKFALENAVDDMDDGSAQDLNSSLDGVMNHQSKHISRHHRPASPIASLPEVYRDGSPRRLHQTTGGSYSARLHAKAGHDRPLSVLDSDSGVGSYTGRSGGLSRSRSLSRLHTGSTGGGDLNSTSSVSGSQPSSSAMLHADRSLREMQVSLDDSESRRSVLMVKLKEAQTTLELQGDRLRKIETSAKENSLLVEDLKKKEKEYRIKINQLESAEKEKQMLQVDNMRLREEMQERISALDYQLKYLKSQHHNSESENNKRISLLDHTTMALSLLEEENSKLQQEKEKLLSEIALLRDAFCLTKTRFGALDEENKNVKNEAFRLKEDNSALSKKVQEMAGQMIELRSLLQAVKDENERLSTTWRSSAEDKTRTARQVEGYQDTINDIKARLAATSADRDRLFQEKLEMNSKIQQMVLDKEQLMKEKLNLEDQLNEQASKSPGISSKAMDVRRDFDQRELNKELASVKKVSEELSAELSTLKSQYEQSLEQVASLERSKVMFQSQSDLGEQERRRMQSEIDRLNQALTDRSHEQSRTHDYQDEQMQRLRSDLKELRYQKNENENKIQELESRLAQANEGLREGSALQHSELDTWKSTCERLTSSVTRKESELQNLTDRCHEMEDTVSGLRQEIRALKDKNELLSDRDEEAERLREETRRLLQEKAENEQMIRLLETQKSVLTKSSEDSLGRLSELEHLSEQIDKLRADNEHLRKSKFELELIRDKLVQEKEEVLANSESVFKRPDLDELEGKIGELRDANRQLRDMNETLTQKLEVVDQENSKMKQTFGNGIPKAEVEKLREENVRLQAEFNDLKHEYGALDAKHQRFVINYGHDGDVAAREKQDMIKLRKERDAIQKQVTLLQGQLSLMEGSKKRSEEQISKLTAELGEARAQLTQREAASSRAADGESASSRQETERLKRELESAKDNIRVQEKMMKNLREDLHEERAKKPRQIQESLEDVSSELQQMRGKLQELMGEIERKDQAIETLELDLRRSRGETEVRNEEVAHLRDAVSQMEGENEALRQEVVHIRDRLASDLANEQEVEQQSELKRSKSAKSLQEELAEAVKAKQNGTFSKSRNQSAFLSKSLSSLEPRPSSAPPSSDTDTEKSERPATEGSHRLQSLISKYRSHGDRDEQTSSPSSSPVQGEGPRGIKPLPGFVSSKIVSPKGRFGGGAGGGLGGGLSKAPLRRSSQEGGGSPETPISPLARQDGIILATTSTAATSSSTTKPGRKMLPPPPTSPKPTLPALSALAGLSTSTKSSSGSPVATTTTTTSSSYFSSTSTPQATKSSFMRGISSGESGTSGQSPTRTSPRIGSPRRERDSSPLASLRATLPSGSSTGGKGDSATTTTAKTSSSGLSGSKSPRSSGLGQSLPASLESPLNTQASDSGDHKEINALIQKFDEMAAF